MFLLYLILTGGMLAAGTALARRSRKAATIACAPMLALLVLKALLSRRPAMEANLFPWDAYPWIEPLWWAWPAAFLLGAALVVTWPVMWKRDGLLVIFGLMFLKTGLVAWATGSDHEELRGTVDRRGVCLQTSSYSCTAAASAMLLHLHGVPATEREMAQLCVTRSFFMGTSTAGAARGLRRKLPGRVIRVTAPDSPFDLPVPCVTAIRLSALVGHSIVVEGIDHGMVRVIDPLEGRLSISFAAFERKWLGEAVSID